MARAVFKPVVAFYYEGESKVVLAEWNELWNSGSDKRKSYMSELLGKLADAHRNGVQQPDENQKWYLPELDEWTYSFSRGEAEVHYAVQRLGFHGLWNVVALHFRLTLSPAQETEPLVSDRLRWWRMNDQER
jgi:hypothetical protein